MPIYNANGWSLENMSTVLKKINKFSKKIETVMQKER